MRLKVVVLLVMTALAACASAGTTPRSTGARNVLTQEQLAATNSENLYQAISKLRPDWLTSRGPTSVTDPTPTSPSVFMSGTMLGKVEYLQQVRIPDVTEVRYWDAGSASARFGMGHPRGVIELTRK